MMNQLHKIFWGFLSLLIISANIPLASAQQIGLAANRSVVEVDVFAGSTFTDDLTIFNNSPDQALPVTTEVSLWTLDEETDEIEFIRAEESLNAALWFDFEPGDFIIDPGSSRDILFSITPPRSTAPGSYLAMIRLKPALPEFYFAEQGPRFLPELGIPVFIRVPQLNLDGTSGDTYQVQFLALGTEDRPIPLISNLVGTANAGVFDSAVEQLIARIQNDGIYHFRMRGVVEVKNVFGKVVEKQELPGRYFIPGRSRQISIPVLPQIEEDEFSSWGLFWYKFGRLLKSNSYIGPYSATILMSMPDGSPVSETINFWVLPWKLWLFVLLTIAFLVFWARPLARRVRKAFRVLMRGRA